MSIPRTDAIRILELAEELAKAERDLAYAESAFDRLGRRDRQKEVDEARAALVSALGVTAWREPLSQDPHTQAQAAAVMLLHGTPEQRAEALRHVGVVGTGSAAGHSTSEFSNLSTQAHGYGVSRPDHQTFSQQTPTGPENGKA